VSVFVRYVRILRALSVARCRSTPHFYAVFMCEQVTFTVKLSVPHGTPRKHVKEYVMDLAYVGLCVAFAVLTFLFIEGCARLGGKE
jgi:hypothetical protein